MTLEKLFELVGRAGKSWLIHDYQANGSALGFVGEYTQRRVEVSRTHRIIALLA